MRCKNCGWENADGQTTCEKCHSSLGDAVSANKNTTPVSERMKSTVAERVVFDENLTGSGPKTCPKCGYPISDNSTSCPNCDYELVVAPTAKQTISCAACGAKIDSNAKFCSSCGCPINPNSESPRKIQRSAMGTVMGGPVSGLAFAKQFCTLKPIAWSGEDVNYNPITYSGDTIILNRANTDANNNSITSREQAVLTYEDGEWYIENRSELRTTFIRVNGRVKLNSGDIIVLGNREFEFKG